MLVGPHVGDNRRGRRLVEHKHKQNHKHKVCTQLLLKCCRTQIPEMLGIPKENLRFPWCTMVRWGQGKCGIYQEISWTPMRG